MSVPPSDLVEIAKFNSDFKKNYGKLIGAYLYLRSISAARGRSCVWTTLAIAMGSAGIGWLKKYSLGWLR